MVRAAALTIALSANILAAEPAKAAGMGNETGNDLMEMCGAERGSFRVGMCYGYIAGALQRDKLVLWMQPANAYSCALPPGVTNGQIVDVVVADLKAHPEKRHYLASSLVLSAIKDAFCKK